MSKTVSLLLVTAIVCIFGVKPARAGSTANAPFSQLSQRPLEKCRPDIASLLFEFGWTYATKSSFLTSQPKSCQEPRQEIQRETADQEAKIVQSLNRLANLPANEALSQARTLYIRPRSSWFNSQKLERELLKRKEFSDFRLEITRSINNSDLVLEITRKTFTTRFTCSFLERGSERVLAGTTASSLSGEIEPHLADAIIKQFKAARQRLATETKPE